MAILNFRIQLDSVMLQKIEKNFFGACLLEIPSYLWHILFNLSNLLNSENGRLPKTESQSLKESESLEEGQQVCLQILDLTKVSKIFCF